jgi:hypothetical protein
LCVPDTGASSLLTLTLSFRKERRCSTAELQDLPVKIISRIVTMLIPFRTDKVIGRLLKVPMTAVGRKQPSLALTVFVAGIGPLNAKGQARCKA